MSTYTDEYIEHWGAVFCEGFYFQTGITFREFLERPEEFVALFKNDAKQVRMAALLPAQKRVQERFDREQLAQDMVDEFERNDHVMAVHGEQTIEPIRKSSRSKGRNKLWKTGLGLAR